MGIGGGGGKVNEQVHKVMKGRFPAKPEVAKTR